MSSDSEESSLYFYAQRNTARRFKRVRKEPEELPQALRYFKYANLNPRIAAFLGKQDPKNLVKRSGQKGGGQDEKDGNGEAKPAATEANINDSLGLLGFGDAGLSQEARSLLPEIGQGGLVKMGAMEESFGPSRLSFNEADDPQRYQFEETTFAAPNILRELSDTLARFDHAFREYTKRMIVHEDVEDSENSKPSDVLPKGLNHILCQEWPELISETIYTPRLWQSQAYKSGYKYASTLASGRQMTAASGAVEKDSGAKGDMKGMVDLLDGARMKPSTKSLVADSSTVHKRKGKEMDKDVIKTHLAKLDDRLTRHGGNPTLSFNLSSKRAFDEGWVVNAPPDPDLEQSNLLEWATGRLQMAIKQKEDEEDYARKKGCDKPTIIRYYGDSRRDTLMKLYRKSNESESLQLRRASTVPKIPQLSKIDNAQREKFMVQLPDASTTIFYPSTGEVAIMASAVPFKPGEVYVNCYDSDEERTCLAAFTPYGKSCCYHKNGAPALILSEIGGVLKSDDGNVIRKWNWPKYGKMKENIIYHINKEMYVRVLSRENVTLYFSCSRETHKIPVGAVPGVMSPTALTADAMGVLQAGLRLTSKSALEHSGPMRSIKDEKQSKMNRTRRHLLGMRKQTKKNSEIEELKKSLDTPERFEFESQADRELQRLQYKSKNIVEDWMEHYRVAVGISSPALKKMMDRSVIKSSKRAIRSAVERKTTSGGIGLEEAAEDLIRGSTRYQSFRSPSAPPKHMVLAPKKRTSVSSEPESKIDAEKRTPGTETPHVRIDEGEKDQKPETAGKRVPTRQYKSASSIDSHGRTPGRTSTNIGQRILRSSILTSMSAHHPQTPGRDGRSPQDKVWSPATEACPVVTRLKLIYPDSLKVFACKCSKHRVPYINDIEFDVFLREVVPVTQLIVVSVINSLHEDSNPYSEMLENIYVSKNKNRTKPCLQCRHDQYRILRYDLARAHIDTDRSRPLQLERHCVVPGMTLMYCGGRLLFADHIFNGYGNARKDFRKQIFKSRQDFHMGHFLPDDFRFSPSRGKPGARAAWGGEIGGTGVRGKGKPGLLPGRQSVPATLAAGMTPKSTNVVVDRLSKSASYSSSSQSDLSTIYSHLKTSPKSKFDSAREFVQFSLSAKVYVQPPAKDVNQSRNQNSISPNKSSMSTGDPVLSQMNNFLMLQTVK
uniref:uncharacterized protein LOC120336523 isoform X2 n=1 Tax=Styela clava TaxID=7725 RepID=UPI00193A974C|nr:uncharacterized protein LOC120336523 isoform X2 [Styela clava]